MRAKFCVLRFSIILSDLDWSIDSSIVLVFYRVSAPKHHAWRRGAGLHICFRHGREIVRQCYVAVYISRDACKHPEVSLTFLYSKLFLTVMWKCFGPVACARLALVVFGGPEVHIAYASCREAAMGFYYASFALAFALCVWKAFCKLYMSRRHQDSSAFWGSSL